ncbi:MAG: hypothetical protein Q9209_006950 [Squamulea sp. 1 TL-2023]
MWENETMQPLKYCYSPEPGNYLDKILPFMEQFTEYHNGNRGFPFLKLPPELQLQVLSYFVPPKIDVTTDLVRTHCGIDEFWTLASVSKDIRANFLKLLYSRTTFMIHTRHWKYRWRMTYPSYSETYLTWMKDLPDDLGSLIKNIIIDDLIEIGRVTSDTLSKFETTECCYLDLGCVYQCWNCFGENSWWGSRPKVQISRQRIGHWQVRWVMDPGVEAHIQDLLDLVQVMNDQMRSIGFGKELITKLVLAASDNAEFRYEVDNAWASLALPARHVNEITFTTGPFDKPSSTQYPPVTTINQASLATSGIINTVLETDGRPSIQPFPTNSVPPVSVPTVLPTIVPSLYASSDGSTTYPKLVISSQNNSTRRYLGRRAVGQAMIDQTEVFQPVATQPPPPLIPSRGDHPAPRLNIAPQSAPLSTNKFYANFFLGSQSQGVWTHPYSLTWSKGTQSARSWGMAISHIDANQRVFGPRNNDIPGSPARYYINPVAIQSIIISAAELGSSTILTTDSLQAFSANANLLPRAGSSSKITFPLVQGMGFVTGVYTNLQPVIQSSVFFRSVTVGARSWAGTFKYQITLEDDKSWLLYATPRNGQDPQLSLVSSTELRGVANWSGFIQVAKNPAGPSGEFIHDNVAGIYATGMDLTASTFSQTGTYEFRWKKDGLTGANGLKLLMFALPHHVESFAGPTPFARTPLRLQTTTKGISTAVVADYWTLVEANLPVDLGFAPWNGSLPQGSRSTPTLSPTAIDVINKVADSEIKQDMGNQTDLDSMYFSGKALSKFAALVYAVHELCEEPDFARLGLSQLKVAFAKFSTNQQRFPLVYDTAWKGLVSSGSYITGDAGQDFGNTYYNDHHFHYAYFIHAASIIAYLDPQWLQLNKEWVDLLVRDAANPSTSDPYFPFSRAFDWYHGHSWAKGLFESADAKDEESSSEDAFFAYAIKMWGKVTGDRSMEARGNLMLSVLARTLRNYFLMQEGNMNHPAEFVGNMVSGVLFENKVDATTYFGTNLEYIHGIHMLPLLPYSSLTRPSSFIQSEWSTLFDPSNPSAPDPASSIQGGWKGILYANLALIDPKKSWDFFAQNEFDERWIDGGASRTWYLAMAAGLGGAP